MSMMTVESNEKPAALPQRLARTSQNLPIPLGGLVPVHRHTSPWIRTWRRQRVRVATLLVLAAVSTGAWLGSGPPTFSVATSGSTIRIDDVVLTRSSLAEVAGTRVYVGAAALALTPGAGGTTTGGAVLTWDGRASTGRCLLSIPATSAPTDACRYRIGRLALTSVDVFDPHASAWTRRYSDGVTVRIDVSPGSMLIPIPIPLGR